MQKYKVKSKRRKQRNYIFAHLRPGSVLHIVLHACANAYNAAGDSGAAVDRLPFTTTHGRKVTMTFALYWHTNCITACTVMCRVASTAMPVVTQTCVRWNDHCRFVVARTHIPLHAYMLICI